MRTETAPTRHIPTLKKLWKQGFGDSDDFIEWYFNSRFDPALASVTSDDGEVVSMAFCQPMSFKLRDKRIPAAMLNGVYTLPEYRKQGLMHDTVLLLENIAAKNGMPIMINTPAGKNHYHTLGHRYITNCEKRLIPSLGGERPQLQEDILSYTEAALTCYSDMCEGYSCMIARDISAQRERFCDYLSDGAKLLPHYEGNRLAAYAILYELGDKYLCPECVFDGSPDGILEELSHLGKPCTVKLPSKDTPTAVGCITDASSLLKLMELPYSIEVTDEHIKSNNGIFSLDGKKHEPAFKISAPSLMQLLCGYLTFSQICDIIIYCEKSTEELASLLPKMKCYMIEEY